MCRLRLFLFCVATLAAGAASTHCAHRAKDQGHAAALLPSEAIAHAQRLGAEGQGEAGLHILSDALCQRAASERRDITGMSEQTAAAIDIRMVNAWVSLWDVAGRPNAPREAVAKCYGSAPVSLLLAVALADASGDWSRAIALAEQRESVDAGGALRDTSRPLAAELALRHAVALLHLGQNEAAIAQLRRDTVQFADHFGLKLALAQAELALGNPAGVREALWPMLRQALLPDVALLARARALMQAAREAAAPAMTPADAAEYADLTRLVASGDLGADDVAHVRQVAQETLQPQLFSWCAVLLFKHGDASFARKLLQRARRALPLDPTPLRLLAAQQISADDYDAALPTLMEAVRRDPFDAEHQAMLAHVAERVDNRLQLRAALEVLVRLLPGDGTYYAQLSALDAREANGANAD